MKIAKNEDAKFFSNLKNSTKFRIKASSKAYQILSTNLYDNNVRAIIRELSCNAIDAHMAKPNKDHPVFDVFLPTTLDPKFYIEDYGIGMSEKELDDIYPVYFESTKDDSNDAIGGLGLGSKTPFSYTSQFTVVSCKDNKKTTGIVFLDEEKLPNLSIIQSVPYKESGTKVEFAVDINDIYRFYDEAIKVFLSLTIFPNIIHGKKNFKEALTRYSITFEEYMQLRDKLIKQSPCTDFTSSEIYFLKQLYDGFPVVIMGGVVYPIKTSMLFTNLHDENIRSNNRVIFEKDLKIIYAPIGAVSIDPDREGLTYDKITISYLENSFNILVSNFFKIFDSNKTNLELYSIIYESQIGFHIREILSTYFDENLKKDFKSSLKNDLKKVLPPYISESTGSNILRFITDVLEFNEYLKMIALEKKLVVFSKSPRTKKFLHGYENIIFVNITSSSSHIFNDFFKCYVKNNVITTTSTNKYWNDIVVKQLKKYNISTWKEQSKNVLEIAKNYFTKNIEKILFVHSSVINKITEFGFSIEDTPFDLVKPEEYFSVKRYSPSDKKKGKENYDTSPVFEVRRIYENAKFVSTSNRIKSVAELMDNRINRVFYLVTSRNDIQDLDLNDISVASSILKSKISCSIYGFLQSLDILHGLIPVFNTDHIVTLSFTEFKRLKLWKNDKFIDLISFIYDFVKNNFNKINKFVFPTTEASIPSFLKNESYIKFFYNELKKYKGHETTVFYQTLKKIEEYLKQREDNEKKSYINDHIIEVIYYLQRFKLHENFNFKALDGYNEKLSKKRIKTSIDFNKDLKKYQLLQYIQSYYGLGNWVSHWTHYIALEDKLESL